VTLAEEIRRMIANADSGKKSYEPDPKPAPKKKGKRS